MIVNPGVRRFGGVKPALNLVFTGGESLDGRITFTRASAGTRVNSAGLIELLGNDLPRFDYDPVTLAARGLLIEESRQNILLNSTIDGANLVTQKPAVALTAAPWTLSFYGTGTVTVKDVTTGTVANLTGSGAYPTRSSVTFTPAAGAIPVNGVTVTGTVQYAQLELGSFVTSYIPTTSAAVTRAADVASMTGTNFSSWFNAVAGVPVGTFIWKGDCLVSSGTDIYLMEVTDGATKAWTLRKTVTPNYVNRIRDGSTKDVVIAGTPGNSVFTFGVSLDGTGSSGSVNGGTVGTGAGVVAMNLDRLMLSDIPQFNGHIQRLIYYNKRLPDATLQVLST